MSSTLLKIVAVVLMVIDHVGEFIPGCPIWFRWIGRLSAPIFIYCMIWGYTYTRSKKSYMIRLYFLSAGMAVVNVVLDFYMPRYDGVEITNNIFGTLFAITEIITLIEYRSICRRKWKYYVTAFLVFQLVSAFLILFFATGGSQELLLWGALLGNVFINEGRLIFVILGLLFYYTKEKRLQLVVGYSAFCVLLFVNGFWAIMDRLINKFGDYRDLIAAIVEEFVGVPAFLLPVRDWEYIFCQYFQWMMIGSLPFILLYNRKRGADLKWFFYIFYPVHIYLLWWFGRM